MSKDDIIIQYGFTKEEVDAITSVPPDEEKKFSDIEKIYMFLLFGSIL